ncbi:LCP family protein [Aggregatilinea lenta]|uniref:LCP family protein n=1 Tax=Aggregatilinea lenta TaxID=913108 RepID=UPI0013C37202|nr:LCP family protein [Aggregatilinea lenta]
MRHAFRFAALLGLLIVLVGSLFAASLITPGGALAALQATIPPTNTPRATIPPTNTPRVAATDPATVVPTQPAILPTPTLYYPDVVTNSEQATAIPTAMPRLRAVDDNGNAYNVLNVLLLGHDGDIVPTDPNFHTDTMIVVSVNRDTNTVSMLSLPRDLFVYIPNFGMGRLNQAYAYGESIGWTDGGWGMLAQTILYNFGIDVHYYAMIDFEAFEQIIDTVGGVTVAVDCPIQDQWCTGAACADGVAGNETNEDYELRTLDVGVYDMDADLALWYSRSRANTLDFDRGRRQQQILRAIWARGKDLGMIAELPSLWDQMTSVVQTNFPLSEALTLAPLALTIQPNDIENHFFRKGAETVAWQPASGPYAGAYVQLPGPNGGMNLLLEDFISPPTSNRLRLENPGIQIYNGTANENWDLVAQDRLIWEGFAPQAMGHRDGDYPQTVIIDHTGSSKGSSLNDLVRLLNVAPNNIQMEPDPNRTVDFEIILGSDYNSCVDRQWVAPKDTGS